MQSRNEQENGRHWKQEIERGSLGLERQMLNTPSHTQSPASDFYIGALVWERMCAELRNLERGQRERRDEVL